MDAEQQSLIPSPKVISESILGDYRYPREGNFPFQEPVTDHALKEVEAIKDKALSLGWSEAHLMQNRGRYKFPSGADYGLITLLRGRVVKDVKAHVIRMTSSSGVTLSFYRPDKKGNPGVRLIPPR